jgi:hypothetical protein
MKGVAPLRFRDGLWENEFEQALVLPENPEKT